VDHAPVSSGFIGPLARQAADLARKRPDMRRRIAPAGFGGSLTSGIWSDVAGLARQSRSGQLPMDILFRMRLDPQIRIGLRFLKAPLATASFWIESDDPAEEALLTEIVVNRLIRRLLRTSTLAYDFGFAAHELSCRVDDVKVSVPGSEGKESEQVFSDVFLIHSANAISPDRVTVLRRPGTFSFAGLAVAQDGGEVLLGPEQVFVFSNESEFGDLYGRPRIHSAYEPWYDGQVLRFAWSRYIEMSGAPQVKAWIPTDEDVFDGNGNPVEDPVAYFGAILPDVIKSSSVIALDGTIDPVSKLRKWDLEYMQIDSRKDEFQGRQAEVDVKKLRALCVPERVATQDQSTGSYGMSETHLDVHLQGLNEDLDAFVDEVNDHLLSDLMRVNDLRGKVQLRTTGISRESREVLLKVYEKITDAELAAAEGRITPDAVENLTTAMVDAEKLLAGLRVPVVRGRPRPVEIKGRPGQATTKEAKGAPETGRTGGAGAAATGRKQLSRRASLASSGPIIDISELEDLFSGFLVAEEALLADLSEPYRREIESTEKGVRGIALLALLRARRQRVDGTAIPPTNRFNGLGYGADGKLLPLRTIAKNHDKIVAAAKEILPSLDGTTLVQQGNKGLVARTTREIEGTIRDLLADLREIRPPGEYLDRARKLAGDQFDRAADVLDIEPGPLAEKARVPVPDGGLPSLPKDDLSAEERELVRIEETNEDGFDRNVENITIRGNRHVAEIVGNAFFTNRRLAKGMGILDELLEWHLHPNYTDLTLEAHFRAVYRKVWLELAREAGLRYFVQIHPPITVQGEDANCRGYDGRIGSYDDWGRIGEKKFNTADPLDQFGMHHGCRAFWFPVPAETVVAALKDAEPGALLL